ALPMMYMDDAVRATIELMEAPVERIRERGSYNLAGISFTPAQLADAIRRRVPGFEIRYAPAFRQAIARGWPNSIDDTPAREDWGWKPTFGLEELVQVMLENRARELEHPIPHGACPHSTRRSRRPIVRARRLSRRVPVPPRTPAP